MGDEALVKAGVEATLKPFANLIERLFGGTVDEIGGMWQDSLKVRRQLRQVKLMEKLQKALSGVEFEPQPIPDKIWMPILQAASMEDDDELQNIWASLLANASNSGNIGLVHPSYVEIVRQLSSREATLLQWIYNLDPKIGIVDSYLKDTYQHLFGAEGMQDMMVATENLLRLGLLTKDLTVHVDGARMDKRAMTLHSYKQTELGAAIIRACTAPKKSQDPSS